MDTLGVAGAGLIVTVTVKIFPEVALVQCVTIEESITVYIV